MYIKETINGILHRGKTLKGENPKKYSVGEIRYSKYQLIKSMRKVITSLILQKSLEADGNSRIQSN